MHHRKPLGIVPMRTPHERQYVARAATEGRFRPSNRNRKRSERQGNGTEQWAFLSHLPLNFPYSED